MKNFSVKKRLSLRFLTLISFGPSVGRIAGGLVDHHHGVGRAQARLVGVATGKLLEKVDGGLFRPGMLTGAFCFF